MLFVIVNLFAISDAALWIGNTVSVLIRWIGFIAAANTAWNLVNSNERLNAVTATICAACIGLMYYFWNYKSILIFFYGTDGVLKGGNSTRTIIGITIEALEVIFVWIWLSTRREKK